MDYISPEVLIGNKSLSTHGDYIVSMVIITAVAVGGLINQLVTRGHHVPPSLLSPPHDGPQQTSSKWLC